VPKVASLAIVVALLAVGGLAPEPAVAAKAKRCRVPAHHAKLLAKSRQLLVYRDFRLDSAEGCIRNGLPRSTAAGAKRV
jgi:hypothetical protein